MIFYAQAAYIRTIGGSRATLRLLVYAQEISASVQYFMFLCSHTHIIFYAQAAYIRAFSVVLPMLYRLFWDLLVSLLALLGFPGLSYALLGSSGLSGLYYVLLGSLGSSWTLLEH